MVSTRYVRLCLSSHKLKTDSRRHDADIVAVSNRQSWVVHPGWRTIVKELCPRKHVWCNWQTEEAQEGSAGARMRGTSEGSCTLLMRRGSWRWRGVRASYRPRKCFLAVFFCRGFIKKIIYVTALDNSRCLHLRAVCLFRKKNMSGISNTVVGSP